MHDGRERFLSVEGFEALALQLTGAFGIVLVEVHGEIVRNLHVGQTRERERERLLAPH